MTPHFCHPEQREGPVQFAGADRVHGSFVLLRMTRPDDNTCFG